MAKNQAGYDDWPKKKTSGRFVHEEMVPDIFGVGTLSKCTFPGVS
jgi:hypothetical protein